MLRRSIMAAVILLAALPAQVQGQVPCLEKQKMRSVLEQRHGEAAVVRGIAAQAMMFELFINPKTKTWTVILTSPNDISCLVGQGTGIEFLEASGCYRRSKEVKSNLGYTSASRDQTSYRQICAQGSSQMATARARSGEPPLPR